LTAWVSRESAHEWASRWVEGDDPAVDDLMVSSALQRLHGLDLVWTDETRSTVRHGGTGTHVHSMPQIRQAFTAWRAACGRYDADPAEYIRRMKEAARSATAE
jgi:hypothetical protein